MMMYVEVVQKSTDVYNSLFKKASEYGKVSKVEEGISVNPTKTIPPTQTVYYYKFFIDKK